MTKISVCSWFPRRWVGTRCQMSIGAIDVSSTLDLVRITYAKCVVPKNSILLGTVGASKRQLLGGISHGLYMMVEAVVQTILVLCERVIASLEARLTGKRIVMEDLETI